MPPADGDFASVRTYLAVNVARLRQRRHWTQQQAADAMGLDLKHLQKLEYGDLNPSLRTLVRVAAAFGVSVGRLLAPTAAPRRKRPRGRPSQTSK